MFALSQQRSHCHTLTSLYTLCLTMYSPPHAYPFLITAAAAAAVTGAGVSAETGGLMYADSDSDANNSSSDELLVVKRRFLAGASDPEELQPLEVDEAAARTERRKRKVYTHNLL
jgi:hypothetical protein